MSPDSIAQLGPWGAGALVVAWLLREIAVPFWQRWRYQNGHDRRDPKEGDNVSHQQLMTTLGGKIDGLSHDFKEHRKETKQDFEKVHGRITDLGREVSRLQGAAEARSGGDD